MNHLAHKGGKNLVRNLQKFPQTRLVRGKYSMAVFWPAYGDC